MRRFLSFLIGLTLLGLFSVYAEVEAVKIGYVIHKQEELKVQWLDRGRALQYNIAHLEAPHNLERRLEAQKIKLEPPKTWQTLVMPGANAGRVSNMLLTPVNHQPFFTKFFVGTAQAEAKESPAR